MVEFHEWDDNLSYYKITEEGLIQDYWECMSCGCNYKWKKNARLDGAGEPFVRCPDCGFEEDL
jgi:DNA-directed RNA polymerase subunit RPC12/RpoP